MDSWTQQQIYNHRERVGLVSISKAELISIAEFMSSQFAVEDVAVIVGFPTQRTLYLKTFSETPDDLASTDSVTLIVQAKEGDGFLRQLQVVLGQDESFVRATSIDEAWAIGVVSQIRRRLRSFELPRVLHFDGIGATFNQLLLVFMVAYLPEITGFGQRLIYVVLIISVMLAAMLLSKRLVPQTYVELNPERASRIKRLSQKFASVGLGLLGAAIATFVTLKFQEILNWLEFVVVS